MKYSNKLYARTKFARNQENEISNCYWSCVNAPKGCKATIRYSINQLLAGENNDGMSDGISDIVASDHDDEYCHTNATDILVRNARNDILSGESHVQFAIFYLRDSKLFRGVCYLRDQRYLEQ